MIVAATRSPTGIRLGMMDRLNMNPNSFGQPTAGKRMLLFVLLLGAILGCFLYAALRPQLTGWWRHHGGGLPYVYFWALLGMNLFPQRRYVFGICLGCVLFTCLLEAVQLYHGAAWPEDFRETALGAALLGRAFDAWDIPPYIMGGVVAWYTGRLILGPNSEV